MTTPDIKDDALRRQYQQLQEQQQKRLQMKKQKQEEKLKQEEKSKDTVPGVIAINGGGLRFGDEDNLDLRVLFLILYLYYNTQYYYKYY